MVTHYLKIWWQLGVINFNIQYVASRISTTFLILGKIIRFGFFFFFLVALLTNTKTLAGFSLYQTLLFFMTFNFVDITIQFLLRGIYLARQLVREGQFDSILVKPINPLFRVASHNIDFLDFFTLVPTIIILGIVISRLETPTTFLNLLIYFALVLNGLVVATAIHIIVAAVAVWTQEIEQEIWIYRDLMTMGRFPLEIYSAPVKTVITFIIPVAVMVTFPAKALLGILSTQLVIVSLTIGVLLLAASLKIWSLALKNYTSVSG